MTMTLEEFLDENYSDILVKYHQFQRKDGLPQIGTKVETLVWGYGGSPGIKRTVVDHAYKGRKSDDAIWGNNYLVLSGGYLCEMENWWNELKIINPTK